MPAPSLTPDDITKAIQCTSKACKGSMQYRKDQDYVMIIRTKPHLKELIKVINRRISV